MIKKRSRPQPRARELSVEDEPEFSDKEEGDDQLPIADLLELRKLRRSRQGIDATKLNKGDTKRKKRPRDDGIVDEGGLRKGTGAGDEDEEKAKKAIRSTNFTQQTNALDVDKHMMAYIEENLKIRSRPKDEATAKPVDPQDALFEIVDRWKLEKQKQVADEGSEVDLGMDTRLKNIEDTEKAKRVVSEVRQEKRPVKNDDEEHLVASRFYRPHIKAKSDADIIRDAKLEAMGLPPQEGQQRRKSDKPQMATDEMVMERFKKRQRK
ncbi:hepatocellular carcinoma-associated antigen 59-domain-containing protein [Mycena floridula]|nr:hepatocellular carcinoma-associated antigen 59-domain-containing protein [Mycena floridula]